MISNIGTGRSKRTMPMTWTKVNLLLGAALFLSSNSAFGQILSSGGGVIIRPQQIKGEPYAAVLEQSSPRSSLMEQIL